MNISEALDNARDIADRANVDLAAANKRIASLEAHLRLADDIEHSISAEDWYKERDALLTTPMTDSKEI
jgi:hypothetical protein